MTRLLSLFLLFGTQTAIADDGPTRDMTRAHRERSPLGRNINHSEVANTALFLLSDMASGITGAIIPVDAGYGIVAL